MRRTPHQPDKWWAEPVGWVELFALSNLAFLAVDVAIAHAVNAFAHPAEYVPVAFSLASPPALVVAMVLGGIRPSPVRADRGSLRAARAIGFIVGWGAIAVGISGMLLHLNSSFIEELTMKNLVYTAPFVAPLAYSGIGLVLVLNRMVDSRTMEWSQWVILLALGGFAGNFILTLADHAQNGFFRPSEWIGVIASAWAVSGLCACMIVPNNRPLLVLVLIILGLQVGVGMLGFYLHVEAGLRSASGPLWDRIVYGAPVFAPLLFADLATLGALGLWGVYRNQEDEPTMEPSPATRTSS